MAKSNVWSFPWLSMFSIVVIPFSDMYSCSKFVSKSRFSILVIRLLWRTRISRLDKSSRFCIFDILFLPRYNCLSVLRPSKFLISWNSWQIGQYYKKLNKRGCFWEEILLYIILYITMVRKKIIADKSVTVTLWKVSHFICCVYFLNTMAYPYTIVTKFQEFQLGKMVDILNFCYLIGTNKQLLQV